MKRFIFLLPLFISLPLSAQKLASNALQAARQHQVTRGHRVQAVTANDVVSGFIRINDATAIPQLEELGITVRSNIKNQILTANIPVGAIEAAAELSAVERIELGEEAHPMMNIVRAEAGADKVRAVAEGLDRAYKGKGVIVGVVDQGFEYTHIDFKAEDGTTPRLLCAWNQNYQSTPPAGFNYGTEYKNFNSMSAAGCDYKYDTFHGSHVAGIAAGADLRSDYYGIATESDLIFVTYQNTADQVVDGVKYIFDKADEMGKPCVVNISIGMHTGPHDGTSLTDQALEALVGPGRIIVGAVGNEGTVPMHVRKTVTPDNPMKVIPALANGETKQFICDFWGDIDKTFYIQPIAVNTLKGTIVSYGTKVCSKDIKSVEDVFDISEHGISAITSTAAVHDLDNGRGNFFVTGNVLAQGTGRMLGFLITTEEDECTVNGWNCYHKEFSASTNCLKQGFTAGDYECLAGEIGGTSRGVISVGSYNTRFQYTSVEGVTYAMGGPEYTMFDLSPFSSNGPTADGRIKPEVCAPGFGVISAAQRYAIQTGTCAGVTKDEKGNAHYYEIDAGTSMASPYVAGSVALWLEANPQLSPDDIRNILRATSRRDAFTGNLGGDEGTLPEGDYRWGYGKIDTFAGLLCAISYDDPTNGIVSPGLTDAANLRVVLDRKTRQLTLFVPDTQVEVFAASGRLVARGADLSHLPAGTYVVRLKSGNMVATQKIVL